MEDNVAERVGFEPTWRFSRLSVFETDPLWPLGHLSRATTTVPRFLPFQLLSLLLVIGVPARGDDVDDLAARVDRLIEGRLSSEKVTAAPLADDAEFLRRVYLDLGGRIPPRPASAGSWPRPIPPGDAGLSPNCSPARCTLSTSPMSGARRCCPRPRPIRRPGCWCRGSRGG